MPVEPAAQIEFFSTPNASGVQFYVGKTSGIFLTS
jgi:hypothetical protein